MISACELEKTICWNAPTNWAGRVFDPPEDNPVQKFSRSVLPQGKRVKDHTFGFDRIFDENALQQEVYEGTTRGLLDNVFDGYNATVFAYGATGCGKTHTITGTHAQPGIIFLTMQELFERVSDSASEKVSEISLSYLEIYNETIRDLLVPTTAKGGLALREDSNHAVSVAGLSTHIPQNVTDVMDLLVRGNENRTMSPTEANATSSRSHAVLQINIIQKDRNASVNEAHTMATLSIIDLAGSERASATRNRGERLIEGANINKSLLALGSCINALCDPRQRNHVPYRNSKLTRLLKFSLGGNCKTVMIVCISPSSAHYDETQNTLRYANRAKNIQTKVTRNVFNVNRHVKDFLVKIDEQMALIKELQQQQRDSEAVAFAKFRKQREKCDGIVREGITRIRTAYDNSSQEREEKTAWVVKLKQIERRIALISTWVSAFDQVNEMQEDETTMENLTAIRKTGQGIMYELENSRQHYHQKLSKNNWERAIDSALQNALRQLKETDSLGDFGDSANLTREAELLKSHAERESLVAVAEQERYGEAATTELLLKVHFQTNAAVSNLLALSEEEAVAAAKTILSNIIKSTTDVVSHIVQPNSDLAAVEVFPPTKAGTPKRKKVTNLIGGTPLKLNRSRLPVDSSFAVQSPIRGTPKRRKMIGAKKGVQFTPKKKTPVKGKRGVRWRDDTEDGTLAEYAKTPQKIDFTPEMSSVEVPLLPPPQSSFLEAAYDGSADDSSPSISVPETIFDHKPAKSERFRAGFLSKKSNGSPPPPTITRLSSGSERSSPLRELEPSRVGNRISLPQRISVASSPVDISVNDENIDRPSSVSPGGSDREDAVWRQNSQSDVMKVKTAIRRASLASTSGNNPTTGAARNHRRRSPTAAMTTNLSTGSPLGRDGMFSASQARRMGIKDKNEWRPSVLSPHATPIIKGSARRTTMAGFGEERSDRSIHRLSEANAGRGSLNKNVWR